MKTPTFKEQYNKIVGAYLRNELRPQDSCACFVGNLLNNAYYWGTGGITLGIRITEDHCETVNRESNGLYTVREVQELEWIFLYEEPIKEGIRAKVILGPANKCLNPEKYEENLYKGMERALLRLKELHESKGEVIEDYVFEKRELQLV